MKTYTEKETVIFRGVQKLISDGQDLSALRSQQIAAARGIGKSTLYDYFKTKDEIIINTLIFSMSEQIKRISDEMTDDVNFHDGMYLVFDEIIANGRRTDSVFNYMNAIGGMGKIAEKLHEYGEYQTVLSDFSALTDLFAKLMKKGRDEKIISLDFDRDYIAAVLTGAFATFRGLKFACGAKDTEKLKANAYTMIVKALN